MTRPALRAVTTAEAATVDIYAPWSADINRRDWSAVHVRGDRAPALDIGEANKRVWRR